MSKQKVYVQAIRLNWDATFYSDILRGIGFQIVEPSGVSIDGVKAKAMYGSLSPLYGTTYEDEHAFIERFRCECGAIIGRYHKGEICEKCHKPVEYHETDINITGWISLGVNRIISPYYFALLQGAIGKKVFEEMIFRKYRVTTDGQRSLITADDDPDYEPLSPYAFIGIDEFFANFEEVINYFKSKKKNKVKTFERILEQKRAVFTSHIPIYSTMLRPQSITSDTFYYGGIDKLINTTYSLSEKLKQSVEIEHDYIIQRIQYKACQMWDMNLDSVRGKEGLVRGQMMGGALNNTSRNVICPDPSLRDNEVDLSYFACLELFKYQIIYYIRKLDNCTQAQAVDEWRNGFIFSEKVYNIMLYILEHDDPRLLINRNPTLNYYSILLMKIRTIKKDDNDYTLAVPLSILPGLNADFDGDILNIIGLMNRAIVYMFRKYDPVLRMIISRDTGLLNDYFSITKGQLIDLYGFAIKESDPGCDTEETFEGPDGNYYTKEVLENWDEYCKANQLLINA
jgi:hypothetical protein